MYGDGNMSYFNSPRSSIGSVTIPAARLRFAGAIQFGSQALNAATPGSDTDYVISAKGFNAFIENIDCSLYLNDLEQTCDTIPPTGTNYFIRNFLTDEGHIDIVVLEHQKHVQAMANAVAVVKQLPAIQRKTKSIRVEAFRKALLAEGFISVNTWYKFKKLLKGLL